MEAAAGCATAGMVAGVEVGGNPGAEAGAEVDEAPGICVLEALLTIAAATEEAVNGTPVELLSHCFARLVDSSETILPAQLTTGVTDSPAPLPGTVV